MLAIATRTALTRLRPSVATERSGPTAASGPGWLQRPPPPPPLSWTSTQKRRYFFDAAHHTALTLRELLRASTPGSEALGTRTNADLLRDAMQSLVDSVCPRPEDDHESRSFFNELLSMHLSGLSTDELQSLSKFLKAAGFEGIATESVWSDAVYEDFGYSNGPLQRRQRTLMLPQDWQFLVDHVSDEVAASEKKLVPGSLPNAAESRFARHCLSHAAQRWTLSDRSVAVIGEICNDLCGALGLDHGPEQSVTGSLASRASSIEWRGSQLVLDKRMFDALNDDADGRVFGEVLRDLLEAVMARRLFGPQAQPVQLSPANLMLLHRAIDAIAAEPPGSPTPALCDAATRLLAQAGRFGKVQVMPLTGVALGHVWVGNALSVVPDRTRPSVETGTRYIRPGCRPEPEECTVREWPIRWLTQRENEDLYPPQYAWHITVPVPALRLQQAAREVAQQWKSENRNYRFLGTRPGMPSNGCRASVLKAIEQGMDDEARALFVHFNAGLAEPDSPTEVALRMNRFMQWLRQLAALPVRS